MQVIQITSTALAHIPAVVRDVEQCSSCRGEGGEPDPPPGFTTNRVLMQGRHFNFFLGGQNFFKFSMPPDYWKNGKNSTLYVVIWRYS